MDNQEAYRRAKRRVAAKMAFYIHLAAYLAVNFLLLVINVATSTRYFWFKWRVGVGIHALVTYVLPKRSALSERMIQQEMARQTQRT
jgi:hypothetical protein